MKMTNNDDGENANGQVKKLKYPRAVFFIFSTEFCERFSYFGMRAILALYLRNKLNFNDDTATTIIHAFIMLSYFFPLFGGILADSVLGKFRTVFYLSIVYVFGQIVLAVSAVPIFDISHRALMLIGLLLISIGTGGIKPCVSVIGGDQFVLPQQKKQFQSYFSVFFLTITLGALLSSFLTPKLRSDIQCFGEQDCYSIAFLLPGLLMIVATVIFRIGKSWYVIKNPDRNIVLDVAKCITHAIRRKWKTTNKLHRDHWLDYAEDIYDKPLIADIKSALRVIALILPLPVFWALADQQSSRWIFQATRMDNQIGQYFIEPDQMQAILPILAMTFIVLIPTCLHPFFNKIRLNTPLRKITASGFVTGLAFFISACLELKLEESLPILPASNIAQLQLFNPRNCSLPLTLNNESLILEPYGFWKHNFELSKENQSLPYTANFSECSSGPQNASGIIPIFTEKTISCVFEPSSPYLYEDHINMTLSRKPALRILTHNSLNTKNETTVELSRTNYIFKTRKDVGNVKITNVAEFIQGIYDVDVNGHYVDTITIKLGGVYTLQTDVNDNGTHISLKTITEPNSVHIFWQIPQFVVVLFGEIMFCLVGYEFIFKEAPQSMKAVLQACWLLTEAFGNLIVVITAKMHYSDRKVHDFIIFGIVMTIDMVIFAILSYYYQYRESEKNELGQEMIERPTPPTVEQAAYETAQPDETAKLRDTEAEP